MNRRVFLSYVGTAAAGSLLCKAANAAGFLKSRRKLLRPPGEIGEKDFLSACIRCGLCVQICPVHAIRLADITEGLSAGTAFIDARRGACDFSCVGIQCVLVCPTGALVHEKAQNAERVRIGLAVLKPTHCLAVNRRLYTGHAPHNYKPSNYKWHVNPDSYRKDICELCADKCPIGPGAITMEEKKDPVTGKSYNTPVIHAGCTGCGICEMVCPVTPVAMVVIPGEKGSEQDA